MATVLVTGADRGIGAALVRHYHARGDRAIAACLGTGGDLIAAGLEVEPAVDVTDGAALAALAQRLAGVRLDVVVSNAGAFHADTFTALDYVAMHRLYDINALGPLRVAQALVPLMGAGGKLGIVTSRVGSLGDNASGGMYAYRMSKCAANQAGINLYHELRPRGIADLVRGKAAFGEIIARDRISAAHVIAAGHTDGQGMAVLASERLTIALDALERTYEHVVMDFGCLPQIEDTRLALDAMVDVRLVYRAPLVFGGAPEVVWAKTVQRGSGQRAYKLVFTSEKGKDFVQVVRTSWAEARTWPGFGDLPPPNATEDEVMLRSAPHVESPRVEVVVPEP